MSHRCDFCAKDFRKAKFKWQHEKDVHPRLVKQRDERHKDMHLYRRPPRAALWDMFGPTTAFADLFRGKTP